MIDGWSKNRIRLLALLFFLAGMVLCTKLI
jgi:hypothetical protein